jgi:hypothetical protein
MTKPNLELIQNMFANMRANTKWNLDGDMLWGYFFRDQDLKKLEPVAKNLMRAGYRVVGTFQPEDKQTHFLHIERIETHTPETLDAREAELRKIAAAFCLDAYDGMDVGPVVTK